MYRKMLVPLDTSDVAECVLDHVRDIAAARNVQEVVLFSVVVPAYLASMPEVVQSHVLEEADQERTKYATEYLENTKRSLNLSNSTVSTEIVRAEQPADAILDFIEKKGVDLVVMSSHGRTGLSRWFLGSVAEKITRSSPAPVLLVPSPACRIHA